MVFSRWSEVYGRWSAVGERTVIDVDLQVCFRFVTLERENYTLISTDINTS